MGHCTYCGLPAGLFRKLHLPCKDRHDHALARIPEFARKFFESDLPSSRFCELLQEGARASFVSESELSEAVTRGILDAIDGALEDRLLSEQELERFSSVTDALAPVLFQSNEVREKMVKLDILLQLADRRIPHLVEVGGDLPFDLSLGESVVWIFNEVALYQQTGQAMVDEMPAIASQTPDYFRPSAVKGAKITHRKLREEARGDLVATNRNLFFVRGIDHTTRLNFARISNLRAFFEGLEITSQSGKRRLFAFDDAWFAANLLVGLLRIART